MLLDLVYFKLVLISLRLGLISGTNMYMNQARSGYLLSRYSVLKLLCNVCLGVKGTNLESDRPGLASQAHPFLTDLAYHL